MELTRIKLNFPRNARRAFISALGNSTNKLPVIRLAKIYMHTQKGYESSFGACCAAAPNICGSILSAGNIKKAL